jgi:hypothetical protein
MSRKALAVAAVIVAAGAVVGVKMARQRPAEAAVVARATAPAVILVADPREADSDCGCGKIIRRVREAKARGVTVEEIGPGDSAAARYGVAVVPTVLVMSAEGRIVARREGESGETLAAVDADLAKLEGQKR